MKILTWNVLHRVHAETHSEACILGWPREEARVQGIGAKVAHAMTVEGFGAALLQEVSGDVLAELRARMPGLSVLNHRYPRVPKQKGTSLRDPTEHLVVVAPAGGLIIGQHTFANDPGKGFLMVSFPDGMTVISTHVTWGAKGEPQLSLLAKLLGEAIAPTVLGGDFNAEREVISKALAVPITAPPRGSLQTRPHENGNTDIDHLICKHATLRDLRVLEHDDLSDHRPVAATINAGLLERQHRDVERVGYR